MMQLLFAAMIVFVAGLGWAYFRRTRINAAPSTALEPFQQQGGKEPTLFDIYEMRKRDITLLAIEAAAARVLAENSLLPKVDDLVGERTKDSLCRLCELYLSSTPVQRVYITLQIDQQTGSALQVFGDDCALEAWKTRSAEWIRIGIVAQAVENLAAPDMRDFYRPVTLLFNAAKRIGADPALLFNEVAAIAQPPIAALLRGYLQRAPEKQTLASMGIPTSFFR